MDADDEFPYGFTIARRTRKDGTVAEYKRAKPPPRKKKLTKATLHAAVDRLTEAQMVDLWDFWQRAVCGVSPEPCPNESEA